MNEWITKNTPALLAIGAAFFLVSTMGSLFLSVVHDTIMCPCESKTKCSAERP